MGEIIIVQAGKIGCYKESKNIKSWYNTKIIKDLPNIPEVEILKKFKKSKDFIFEKSLEKSSTGKMMRIETIADLLVEADQKVGKKIPKIVNEIVGFITNIYTSDHFFYNGCPKPNCKRAKVIEKENKFFCKSCNDSCEEVLIAK